ncbi:hypothetical protein KP509_22G011700 [Ceratopteris richardii]|uniref:MACPF domain-containing protein n=1 Tax=Ceratopteris richardii TaxID=49495 RepID=A0A8T2S5Y7_CERRI|nr:hypothetical protein KP509_22G011700 [Ceratopteris richardii]
MADADSALLAPGIIAKVSGGRALRGFRPVNDAKLQLELRNHEPVCVNDERLGEAKIALLRPPSAASANGDCAIRRTNRGSFYDTRWFARKGYSESFRASVTQKGWSLATKIHASSSLAKTDLEAIFSGKKHSAQDENQHESEGESELYVCESFYIPLYSFQIPRNQMLLSEAALQRALSVQTESDAEDFFKSFGAFASEGEYILGGVSIKQKIVKLSEYASLDSLLQTNETETKFGLTGAHSNPWFSIDGKLDNAQGNSTKSILNDQITASAMNVMQSTYILGPNDAKDMPEFLEKLRHDPEKSVAIIDKSIDDRSTLVGVIATERSTTFI